MGDRERLIVEQFGPRAENYVCSAVHASGAELDVVAGRAEKSVRRGRSISAAGGPCRLCAGAACARGGRGRSVRARCSRRCATRRRGAVLRGSKPSRRRRKTCRLRTKTSIFSSAAFPRITGAIFRPVCARRGGCCAGTRRLASSTSSRPGRPRSTRICRRWSFARRLARARLQQRRMVRRPGAAGFASRASRSWRLRMDFAGWTGRIATPPDMKPGHSAGSGKSRRRHARAFRRRSGRKFLA